MVQKQNPKFYLGADRRPYQTSRNWALSLEAPLLEVAARLSLTRITVIVAGTISTPLRTSRRASKTPTVFITLHGDEIAQTKFVLVCLQII